MKEIRGLVPPGSYEMNYYIRKNNTLVRIANPFRYDSIVTRNPKLNMFEAFELMHTQDGTIKGR